MVKPSLEDDGRVIELRHLGNAEREVSRELVSVHEEIANLVQSLLPPHAPSRTLRRSSQRVAMAGI